MNLLEPRWPHTESQGKYVESAGVQPGEGIISPGQPEEPIFQGTPPSSLESRAFQSAPLPQSPVSIKDHIRTFDPLSEEYVANDGPFKPQSSPLERLFSGPFGASHDTDSTSALRTLQDTSPGTAPVNGLMFRRRPPKPAPRRHPKNPDQAVDHHSLSSPAPTPAPTAAPTPAPTPAPAPYESLLPVEPPPTFIPPPPTAVSQAKTRTRMRLGGARIDSKR
ncbi:hypothetical protein NFI96_017934 [Prochilodus magdalenae]|nr:hypothetical protein NFI96_017934 [Prochilodus magdalenae]